MVADMTLIDTSSAATGAPSGPTADAVTALRTLHAVSDGQMVGAWSSGTAPLADLVRRAADWPGWQWIGAQARDLRTGPEPLPHPGRPVAFGVPVTATAADADRIRSLGPWANIAVTDLVTDPRVVADALHRLHPEIGIVDGDQLRFLPDRALSGALVGIVAMLEDFEVLPVLSAAADPVRLVAAARDSGVKVVF